MTEHSLRPTVLLVDDTESNIDLLVETLGEQYELLVALDGEAALATLHWHVPDLILLDVMMPGLDGYEVCRRLKTDPVLREVPVIFLTALADGEHEYRGLQLGAVDYLTKPFDPVLIRARVHNQVQLQRSRLELARERDASRDALFALQRLERLRDDLVQMLAHDMRSPLMGVSGHLQLALLHSTAPSLPPDQRDHLERALAATGTLNEMISSFLDVSRLEDRKLVVTPEELDVRECVHAALERLSGLLPGRRVTPLLPTRPVRLRCDRGLTERILQNLLGNALKFTPEAGTIRIEVAEEPHWVRLSVRDDGPGIPPSHHAKIFEKFGQVAARREGHRTSSGLGLTFCKLAAEAQGGSITLESRVGEGATFHVRLPRSGVGAAHLHLPSCVAGPDPARALLEQPREVLLLDDDHTFVESLRRYLAQHSRWTVQQADTLERTLRMVLLQQPGLIVLAEDAAPFAGQQAAELLRHHPRTRGIPLLVTHQEELPVTTPPCMTLSSTPSHLNRATPLACLLAAMLEAVMK